MLATLTALLVLGQGQAEIPVVWSGEHSKVAKAEISLITNEWDWMRTWLRHTGQTKTLQDWEKYTKDGRMQREYSYYNNEHIPEVNFKSHAVLAIFGGTTHQVAGYSVLHARREGSILNLGYLPKFYSVGFSGKPEDRDQFKGTPYAFILVPRPFTTLKVEEGIIERKGDPIRKFKFVKELKAS